MYMYNQLFYLFFLAVWPKRIETEVQNATVRASLQQIHEVC